MDEFADAVARAAGQDASRERAELEVRHPADVVAMPVVVDPQTGEVHETPADLPSDRLAELAYRLRQAEAERKLWRDAVEDELRKRMTRDSVREAHLGNFQVKFAGNRRRWDAEELEGVVRDLIDTGAVQAGEVTGLIRRKSEVSGTVANRLLDTLTGPARDVIAACFTWEQGRTLRIEPAAQLPEKAGQ